MTPFLVDTHLLLWSVFESDRLSEPARAILEPPSEALAFSVASLWEIAIKRALNKPDFQFDPTLLRRVLLRAGYRELVITGDHALYVTSLPLLHRDPFDRLIFAQAQVEGMTVVTSDRKIARYSATVRLV